ncbi:MAG: pyridoxal phosphate-dependent aminotransferase [Defluviitaleaceae bacterium]|nr:pyridoxal phosphate-dependent aminotransferase [Defluviitaleaceae bacterium]
MEYNFDRVIERRNTQSDKYDSAVSKGKPADVLPLWIADMDFKAPDCVLEALHQRVGHGIFGYSRPGNEYFEAMKGWFGNRFGYEFDPGWVCLAPGVVVAFCVALRAYTKPGDAIIIQEPLYHPIKRSILANARKPVINNLLQREGGSYHIDFADFEKQIIDNNVKTFVLCNPHNPVGRVWSEDELRQLVDICKAHDVLILSDEIWCDLVFPGHTQHLLPKLAPDYRHRIVTFTSASKTFNIADLLLSNTFISDEGLRSAFTKELSAAGIGQPSSLAMHATRAAYSSDGALWLDALLQYISANMGFIDSYLQEHIPNIRMIKPDGTYVAWLDFRQLGLSADELDHKTLHDAKVWLNRGDMFGDAGAGFQRVNAACPRTTLVDCMERLAKAFG